MKRGSAVVVLVAMIALGALAGTSASAAPAYPTRQVELTCSAAPGGGNDWSTRAMAEFASKKFGSPVIVVNRPGGGTVVAVHFALKEAKPDGYTVLSDSQICSNLMVAGMKNPPVTLEDRIFIARIHRLPLCFAVKGDAPWKTFKELGDWVKAHPKELSWGWTGPFGSSAFGIGEWLVSLGVNPLDTRMITSAGWNETGARLLGGHIMLTCQTLAEYLPMARAGRIRVLAIASSKRNPQLPDVPTTAEAGFPDVKGVDWWTGLSVAKGTPSYVVDKWSGVAEEMCKDPTFLEKSAKLDYAVDYLGPADTKAYVYQQAEIATKLAPKLGVRQ